MDVVATLSVGAGPRPQRNSCYQRPHLTSRDKSSTPLQPLYCQFCFCFIPLKCTDIPKHKSDGSFSELCSCFTAVGC